MQGPTDEASVPPTTSMMDSRKMSGTMRRKIGIRTYPWPTAAAAAEETPTLPPPPPPPPEDEELPVAKKPRLQAPSITITSTAIREDGVENAHTAERVTTDSPDDTPTVLVTHSPATSSPRAGASRAPPRSWNEEEDTKLIEAVKGNGTEWVAVAALVRGRTNNQCRQRWTQTFDPDIGKIAGEWTPEEDARLIDAVKKHGTAWIAVAALVRRRTNLQCRSRWTQTLDPDISRKGVKWTPEEDARLIDAANKHGTAWIAVAALVHGRTNLQCRQRWTQTLDPDIGKKGVRWTPEEDARLIDAVKEHGTAWVAVAALVHGRTNLHCRRRFHQRWNQTLDLKWTPEEDARLIDAVRIHGTAWVAVAALVPGRSYLQCRRRWNQTLDPDIGMIAGEWTPEEDARLIDAVRKHGTAWAAVAALVRRRTNNQCSSRWTQTLDPDISKKVVRWTPEEDARLIDAAKKHGTAWAAVAAMMPGRTNLQCRRRWNDIEKKAGEWTSEEDAKLIDTVKRHGTAWFAVSALVPGRTNEQCRRRWYQTLDQDRASNTVMKEGPGRQ